MRLILYLCSFPNGQYKLMLIPRVPVNTEMICFSQTRSNSVTGKSQRETLVPVVFALCSYFQWQGALRSAGWIDVRDRALSLVRGSGTPSVQRGCLYGLSGQIISIASELQILIWLGRPAWHTRRFFYSPWRPTWPQTSAGCRGACTPWSTWSSRSTCSGDKMTKTPKKKSASEGEEEFAPAKRQQHSRIKLGINNNLMKTWSIQTFITLCRNVLVLF